MGKEGEESTSPYTEGQRKARVQYLCSLDGLSKESSFLLLLRLEGLGASRSLFMPFSWAQDGYEPGI